MGRLIDLTGQRFGRLVVVEWAGSDKNGSAIWSCQCDCGNIVTVRGGHLKSSAVQSCGCLKREHLKSVGESNLIDLTGKRFGQLVVVAKAGYDQHGIIMWKCQCDCGNETVVRGNSL